MSKRLEKRIEHAKHWKLHNEDGSCPECGASIDDISISFGDRYSETPTDGYCRKCRHEFTKEEAGAIYGYVKFLDSGYPEGCCYHNSKKDKDNKCGYYTNHYDYIKKEGTNYRQECCKNKCPEKMKNTVDWSEQ